MLLLVSSAACGGQAVTSSACRPNPGSWLPEDVAINADGDVQFSDFTGKRVHESRHSNAALRFVAETCERTRPAIVDLQRTQL